MSDRFVLYHVTTVYNASAIIDAGYIDPERSTGKRSVWCGVTKTMVPWAIAHVANRHDEALSEITVLKLLVHPTWRIRSNRRGVWAVDRRVQAQDIELASVWLDKAETTIYLPSVNTRRGYRYGSRNL